MGVLMKAKAVQHLRDYEYQSSPYTVLDSMFNPAWVAFTEMLPRWVAPNAITLAAFLAGSMPVLWASIFYFHTGGRLPWGYFVTSAVGAFSHNFLDACDGKQARRTGSSSPLGQLFDHGCDYVVAVCRMVGVVFFCVRPRVWLAQLVVGAGTWAVATTQLLEYHSGRFEINFGDIGPTEFALVDAAIHLITAMAPDAWKWPLVIDTTRLMQYVAPLTAGRSDERTSSIVVGDVVALACLVPMLLMGLRQFTSALASSRLLRTARAGDKEIGMHAVLCHAAVPFVAIVAYAGLSLRLISAPADDSLAKVLLHAWAMMLCVCHVNTRLLVAHMCKSPVSLAGLALAGAPFLAAASFELSIDVDARGVVMGPLAGSRVGLKGGQEITTASMALALGATALVHVIYVSLILNDVCAGLGLRCFTLPPRTVAKKIQ